MVSYTKAAVALLLASSSVRGFTARSGRRTDAHVLRRQLSASTYYSEDDENKKSLQSHVDRLSDNVSKVGSEYLESFSRALTDDEVDAYEAELARKEKVILERNRQYDVMLALTRVLGMTLCQVDKGQELSDFDLNLDSLQFQSPPPPRSEANNGETVTMDPTQVKKRLDPNFRGIVVSSVVVGGQAWKSGVRPGDILISTSATLGDVSIVSWYSVIWWRIDIDLTLMFIHFTQALWPKSTLEGVRSAISSRRVASGTMVFRFQRSIEEVASQYELTLTKPLGLEIQGELLNAFDVVA